MYLTYNPEVPDMVLHRFAARRKLQINAYVHNIFINWKSMSDLCLHLDSRNHSQMTTEARREE